MNHDQPWICVMVNERMRTKGEDDKESICDAEGERNEG